MSANGRKRTSAPRKCPTGWRQCPVRLATLSNRLVVSTLTAYLGASPVWIAPLKVAAAAILAAYRVASPVRIAPLKIAAAAIFSLAEGRQATRSRRNANNEAEENSPSDSHNRKASGT